MAQPNPPVPIIQTAPPKHDIHKFRDITPKLSRDNWVSWKRQLLATARDRGLYATITGADILRTAQTQLVAAAAGATVTLAQLIDEWTDRNNTAYNQSLLCISSELQTVIIF